MSQTFVSDSSPNNGHLFLLRVWQSDHTQRESGKALFPKLDISPSNDPEATGQ